MRPDLTKLPTDTMVLQQLVRDLSAGMEQRDGEIEKLRLIIRQLQRSQFGRRSERLDPDQLQFGLEELDADIARAEAKAPEPSVRTDADDEVRSRSSFPAHLPREDMTLGLEGGDCPDCGGALHSIGVTTSEMLDWVLASLRVVRIHRPKYGCRACGSLAPHRRALRD
jgi:transposase